MSLFHGSEIEWYVTYHFGSTKCVLSGGHCTPTLNIALTCSMCAVKSDAVFFICFTGALAVSAASNIL